VGELGAPLPSFIGRSFSHSVRVALQRVDTIDRFCLVVSDYPTTQHLQGLLLDRNAKHMLFSVSC
jgi:hypothetical protein